MNRSPSGYIVQQRRRHSRCRLLQSPVRSGRLSFDIRQENTMCRRSGKSSVLSRQARRVLRPSRSPGDQQHGRSPALSVSPTTIHTLFGTPNGSAPGAVYSFCTTLMCCRRIAVSGCRDPSARSASSRYFAASVIKYSATLGLVQALASLMHRSASCRWSSEVNIPQR